MKVHLDAIVKTASIRKSIRIRKSIVFRRRESIAR